MSTQSDSLINQHDIWRIQDIIDFAPETNSLKNVKSGEEITLFAPAARCLLALIQHQGDIISQKELMHIGWESEGLSVSPNAYYQNIANIRKSFADLQSDGGEDIDIITTIKRSGLFIAENINIEKLESSTAQEIITAPPASPVTSFYTNTQFIILCALLMLMLSITAIVYRLHFAIHPHRTLLGNYFLLKTLPSGCKIYINSENKTNGGSEINALKNLDCEAFQRAYVTRWSLQPRFSVMICSDDGPDNLNCTSYYYASHNND